MRDRSATRLSLAASLLACALPAVAAVYAPIGDQELFCRADSVVVAQSLGSRPAEGEKGETWTRFAAETVLAGTVPSTFEVAVIGGPVAGGRTLVVPDVPAFVPGSLYLLFLNQRPDGAYTVTEHLLGAFDVVAAKGTRFATRSAFPTASTRTPFRPEAHGESAPATGDVVRDLLAFTEWIRAGGTGERAYVRSVDPALLSAVAGGRTPLWNSGWGSSLDRARWNPFPTATVIASNSVPTIDGQGGVDGTGGGLKYEFNNAITWWNVDTESTISLVRGADRIGAFDPRNLPDIGEAVIFLNDTSQFGSAVKTCDGTFAGLVGIGGWLTDGSGHNFKNNAWSTILAGVGWIRAFSCPVGTFPSMVFENVVTSVLGNEIGLSNNPQQASRWDTYNGDEIYAVMTKVFDVRRGTGLGSDDRDAICYIYGKCDPEKPADGSPVPGFSFFPVPAVKEEGVSFRDLTAGQPTGWDWEWREQASGSGPSAGTSNLRNPVLGFPKVGFYQARLTATNIKGSATSTGTVDVRTNLAGELTIPGPTMVGIGASVILKYTGKASQADIHWGDGQFTSVPSPVSPITATHAYSAPGVFFPAVKLTDADRTSDATSLQSEKIFDKATGFVVYPKNCGGLKPPTLVAPATAEPTHHILFRWGAPDDFLVATDYYVIETANNPDFTGEGYWRYTSPEPYLVFPPDSPARAEPGGTLYARVATFRQCATLISSGFSDVVQTQMIQPPPGVTTTPQRIYLSYFPGMPEPTSTLTFLAAHFTFVNANITLTPPPFLTLSSTNLTLAPEKSTTVTINYLPSVLSTPGVYTGSIRVDYQQDTFYVPVMLVVQSGGPYKSAPVGPPNSTTLTIPNRPDPLMTFSAPAGQTPAPVSVTVQISPAPGPSDQWFLDVTELPGWINVTSACGGGENDLNCALFRFPSSGKLNLTFSVNRATRSASHRSSPQYFPGLFRAARTPGTVKTGLPMVDMEGVTVKRNASADLAGGLAMTGGQQAAPAVVPPSFGSFVDPTVSQGNGRNNSRFASDGWIKNASSDPVSVSLYFIPDGADGTTDPRVTKATWPIKPGQAFHLGRLMDSFFAVGDGTGRMEVRADRPQAIVLQGRTEAQSLSDPLQRFGTDIPIAVWGSGAVLGAPEFLIPGIIQNDLKRTNLILTETVGQAALVDLTVRDESGAIVGTIKGTAVPPFSKVQLNDVVRLAKPLATIPNGSISVSIASGGGHVFPVATVVDVVANSFYAVAGKQMAASGAPSTIAIPLAARTSGLYGTAFSTSLFIANGSDDTALLELGYYYIDEAAADLSRKATTSVTIPPRGCLPVAMGLDAIPSLFGRTTPTYGRIEVKGDVHRVAITANINTLLNPDNPSQGLRSAQVPAIDINSEFAFDITSDAHHAMGLERSPQKRTNAIFVSVNALPSCDLRLLLLDAEGNSLGRKEIQLPTDKYLQINDVFGWNGFEMPDGPYRDMVIEASVVCGAGRVLGFVSIIDNVSQSPEIIVMRPAGPVKLY